ncbi:unnamed protein product, partial [Rotaria sp. Silwood2]
MITIVTYSGATSSITIKSASTALEYLKSIGAFPSTQLILLNKEKFTGQFLSSILLAYIDLHNHIQSKLYFESDSLDDLLSFEFHPNTFKQLFDLIERLMIIQSSSNTSLVYILGVCLRLLTTHLYFFKISNIENCHIFEIDENFQ